ncbi:MAG: sulfatase-like hydrolase/transferase [Opitutales bacterium]
MRPSFLLLAFSLLTWSSAPARTNVVLILIDDFGYECVTANGGESYRTPVMDKLAATGVRLDQLHAQPLCTPTRVALMTGQGNKRNYTHFGHLDPKQQTFGNIFKAAGYATCVVGKWQLGNGLEGPGLFGFQEHCLWQLVRRPGRYRNPGLEINGKEVDYRMDEYGPDLVNDYALDFIARKKDQPFFLYYPMMLTHSPYDATPDSPDYRTAKSVDGTKEIRHFPDMVAYTDKMIGKVVAKLEELKLRENTLIVIMGDNGTGAGTPSRFKGRDVIGGKGTSTVWGTHVPGIISWPGHAASGRVCADMLEAADILPTICEAAQVPVPPGLKVEGRSFLPQVRGEKGDPKDALYVWYNPDGGDAAKYEFAHDARFKLYADGRFFDTVADDREKSPLQESGRSAEASTSHARLKALLDAHQGSRDAYFARQGEPGPGGEGARKGKSGKKAAAPAPNAAEADPRVARFKERDADHDGKITYEEFQASMNDKQVAQERFKSRDLNQDGTLSLDEFIATLPKSK